MLSTFAQDGDAGLGIWQSEHGSGRIKIYKDGNTYDGKLVWLKEANDELGRLKLDINNPSDMVIHPLLGDAYIIEATIRSNYLVDFTIWQYIIHYPSRSFTLTGNSIFICLMIFE